MKNNENYYQYIHDEYYDSSNGEPQFENNRYLRLYGTDRNKFGEITLYGKVDNLFLTYQTDTNVGSNTSIAYLRGVYFATSSLDENGLFRHFIIFDEISYHSKFEIEAIRNHCLNIQKEKNKTAK